jgi:hypothetical protein
MEDKPSRTISLPMGEVVLRLQRHVERKTWRRLFWLVLFGLGLSVWGHGCHWGGHDEDIRRHRRSPIHLAKAPTLQSAGKAQARQAGGLFPANPLFLPGKPCNNAG